MAKLKKLPKKPKTSATLATWQKYEARVKEVMKYNNQVKAEAKKKENIIKKYSR